MNRKWKMLFPLMGLLATCSLSAAIADRMDDYSNQPRPAGQMHKDEKGKFNEITPKAGPEVNNGVGLFVTADFILWNGREDGLGLSWNNLGDGTNDVGRGTVKHVNDRWRPGFKAGLGYHLPHDGWDVYAEYTWWYTNEGTNSTSDAGNLYPVWNIGNNFNNPANGEVKSVGGRWKNRMNIIDAEMGRNFFLSQYLKMRPHFGFKGTWQKQHLNIDYFYQVNANSAERPRMQQEMRFWGFGIRSGSDAAWHFNENFSLFGDVAVTALWSKFRTHRKDTDVTLVDQSAENQPLTTVIDTKNSFYTITPVFEYDIGLRYELWFSDDEYHFLIQAAWEEQLWYNMNQFLKLNETGSHGDLGLQGLTVKLRFDF